MAKATVTIQHGQSQSFTLEEGSNVTLASSSDGKGVKIGVTPSENWVNPGLATNNKEGLCPGLPDDDTKFLNGKGQWTVPPSSEGGGVTYGVFTATTDGLVPKVGEDADLDNRVLFGNGWGTLPPSPTVKTYKFAPFLIVDNMACLSSESTNKSLTLSVTKGQEPQSVVNTGNTTSLTSLNGLQYYYIKKTTQWGYGRQNASIFVLKDWADSHNEGKFCITAGWYKRGEYYMKVSTFKKGNVNDTNYSIEDSLAVELVQDCPTPSENFQAYDLVQARAQILGWQTGEAVTNNLSDIKYTYPSLLFANKVDSRYQVNQAKWLIYGMHNCGNTIDRTETLVFSKLLEF